MTFHAGVVREKIAEAEGIREEADREAEAYERSAREILPLLTSAELLALAEECGVEEGPEHCVRCAAWEVYVMRGE